MPVPIAAIALGAGGGVALEAVTSGGKASKMDYAVAATLGALPLGLGARGTIGLASKARKLHKFGRSYSHKGLSYTGHVVGAATQRPGYWPNLSLRPAGRAIAIGAIGSYTIEKGLRTAFEMKKSNVGEDSLREPGRLKTRKSMRGRSAQKRRRRAKILPRRGKRCPPGYRYDRKRKMCIQNNYK